MGKRSKTANGRYYNSDKHAKQLSVFVDSIMESRGISHKVMIVLSLFIPNTFVVWVCLVSLGCCLCCVKKCFILFLFLCYFLRRGRYLSYYNKHFPFKYV